MKLCLVYGYAVLGTLQLIAVMDITNTDEII